MLQATDGLLIVQKLLQIRVRSLIAKQNVYLTKCVALEGKYMSSNLSFLSLPHEVGEVSQSSTKEPGHSREMQ